ncbi:MAG: DUF6056 family protein [Elusimicrobiota bacterium]|jgi:hypothetical protein|nr:DUF6056 family protein [Elusimicrobiota bacterium]
MHTAKSYRKTYYVWAALCLTYIFFIALLSALFPYGVDEYFADLSTLRKTLDAVIYAHKNINQRIGVFYGVTVLCCGKWLFVLLNPLVQLFLCNTFFYFIFLRRPDFKSFKDIPIFGCLLLLSFMAVPAPSETLFWIGGAVNYSWHMVSFMIILCVLRAAAGGITVKDGRRNILLLALAGFATGMSNENNAPMALIICAGFWALFIFNKKRAPLWFYGILAGIAAGLAITFGSGTLQQRLTHYSFESFRSASLEMKLLFHLNHFHDLLADTLLPVITPALAAFALAQNFKTAVKNTDFLLAVLCWAISMVLAFVLFMAPSVGSMRIFYSAGVFAFLAFMLAVKFLRDIYGINFFRYLFAGLGIVFIVMLPLIVLPYFNLHGQNAARVALLRTAKAPVVKIPPLTVVGCPWPNFTIAYYDGIYSPRFAPRNKIPAKVEAVRGTIASLIAPVI